MSLAIRRVKKRKAFENADVKGIFKKMIADKRFVQSYIRIHGTLKGFKNESIVFAKPIIISIRSKKCRYIELFA